MTWLWGRVTALAAIVLAVLAFVAAKGRRDRREGGAEVRRRAQASAEKRKGKRDEIDSSINDGGSADRLRNNWSRD